MQMLALRHGNTFGPGEMVVMVGAKQDPALVPSGLEQAQRCARALTGLKPAAIYAGPLRRTLEYAAILGETLGLGVSIDERLREIDYGRWAGLADAEIAALGDSLALAAWRDRGEWPAGAGFGESDRAVRSRVERFAGELAARHKNRAVLVVTSQGVLRYFLKLDSVEWERRAEQKAIAVKTGHGGLLKSSTSAFACVAWNATPEELAAHLK